MGLETGTYIDDLVDTNPAYADAGATLADHFWLVKSVLQNTFPNVDGACTATPAQFNYVVVTPGTVTLSKAVVVDANKDISGFRHLTATGTLTGGTLTDGTLSSTAGAVTGVASLAIAKDGLAIGGTNVTTTAAELNTLDGVAATLTATELNLIDGLTATSTELNKLDGFTGTVASTAYADAAESAANVYTDGEVADCAKKASNLSDLTSASAARTNLGLGDCATLNVGNTVSDVAPGSGSTVYAEASAIPSGMQLIERTTATLNSVGNFAKVDFPSSPWLYYDAYKVFITTELSGTSCGVQCQVGVGVTPTWLTTNDYHDGTGAVDFIFELVHSTNKEFGTADLTIMHNRGATCGIIKVHHAAAYSTNDFEDEAPSSGLVRAVGSTTDITTVRLYMSADSSASCDVTISLYGVENS